MAVQRKREGGEIVNTIIVTGRLTRDPDLKYTPNNTAVVNFTIASDRMQNGEKTADFLPVSVFGKTAENVAKYMKKGSLVGVEGRMQSSSYTTKNGEKRTGYSIVAYRVEFLQSKNNNEVEDEFSGFSPTDEDIPF